MIAFRISAVSLALALLARPGASLAQEPSPASGEPPQHDHAHMQEMGGGGWEYMQDGALNVIANHQGGPRGGGEVTGTSWYMGMWQRATETRRLTFSAMFSADPLTAGKDGYREIFQVGESLDGRPLVDRQHPHDAFMQLSAAWRTAVGERGAVTLAGGPVGAPALGPVAYMHRPSAAAILSAPLSHHVFDSTHVSFGVATGNLSWGPLTVEGSVFNGREPDEERWDFDFGRLDSTSARVWLRPAPKWTVQASFGRLVEPEALEPGNAIRRTVSAGWWSPSADGFGAATVAYGENAAHGLTRRAFLAEYGRQRHRLLWSARFEAAQVESALLRGGEEDRDAAREHGAAEVVRALTLGGQYDVFTRPLLQGSIGANVTFHASPESLRETHGARPVSAQVFFQLRPNPGAMGRMWNNVMGL